MTVTMTLAQVRKGDIVRVLRIEEERARQQAIRMGIYEGAELVCTEKIHAGPVALMGAHSETAVGRRLAEQITVKLAQDKKGVND